MVHGSMWRSSALDVRERCHAYVKRPMFVHELQFEELKNESTSCR